VVEGPLPPDDSPAQADLLLAFRRELERTYEQIEALLWLTTQYRFRASLPPMRKWAISPDFANLLAGVIRRQRPQTIVELGGGVSTLIAGYALEACGGGTLISVDHAEQFTEAARRQAAEHGLEAAIRFITAPLTPIALGGAIWQWYDPSRLALPPAIDLLVVDGPPQQDNPQPLARYPALPVLFEALRPGALIVLDDADRADETAIVARWLAEFPVTQVERIATEKGAVILQRA
jgi:predicted O-methyltransferase YrrM